MLKMMVLVMTMTTLVLRMVYSTLLMIMMRFLLNMESRCKHM